MTRTEYLNEIQHFKTILSQLDAQHRENGNAYTPSDIQDVRKALTILEQLVHVGLYDAKEQK